MEFTTGQRTKFSCGATSHVMQSAELVLDDKILQDKLITLSL